MSIRATVAPDATGKVTFYDGSAVLGSRAVSAGIASLTTVLLDSGPRSLWAYYAGDGNHASARSAPILQTVAAALSLGFYPDVTSELGTDGSLAYAVGIATGDFNGDGKLDLAIAGGSGVQILLGSGDGTFRLSFRLSTQSNSGPNPVSVAVGDFNGDGKLDVVFGEQGWLGVLLGNGDGTFQAPDYYHLGEASSLGGPESYVRQIVVADFNGDGNPDIFAIATGAAVMLGNGDGTFRAPITFSDLGVTAAVADFNGDGVPDLVMASDLGLNVRLGNGDGSFQNPVPYPAGSYPHEVIAGDFNGDGKTDVAVADYLGFSVNILLGNGNGTFQPPASYPVTQYPTHLVAGDFNGDGRIDLAVAANQNHLQVLFGKGDGTFHPGWDYPFNHILCGFALGDFNGDGVIDLAEAADSVSSYTFGSHLFINYGLSLRLGRPLAVPHRR